jgi:hypothetical protein
LSSGRAAIENARRIFRPAAQQERGTIAMAITITLPEPAAVLASITGVHAALGGETRSIGDWRAFYRQELATVRQRPSIAVFNSFVNNLLERAMSGEAWIRRVRAVQRVFVSFDAVTEETARRVLAEAGYRFPSDGVAVILAAKALVSEPMFSWHGYIEQADEQYETDFRSDQFLRISPHISSVFSWVPYGAMAFRLV